MKAVIISLITLFCGEVFAADLVYQQIYPTHVDQSGSARDFWDKSRSFCYFRSDDPKKTESCLPMTDMAEIKLRDRDRGVAPDAADKAIYGKLSSDTQNLINQYKHVYVRYLAENTQGDFLVHFFYQSGSGTETVFFQGKQTSPTTVDINSVSFSSDIELLVPILILAANHPEVINQAPKNMSEDAKMAYLISKMGPDIAKTQAGAAQITKDVVEAYLKQKAEPNSEIKQP